MAEIEKVIFDLEVVTPMFLGGADAKTAELRAASLKGLMRYWWRALQAESDMEILRKKENDIFGSTDKGGSFAIRMVYTDLRGIKESFPRHLVPVEGKDFKINILEYLAYGTYDYVKGKGNVFSREYIQPNKRFKLIITIRGRKEEILRTFYIFSLFGGIGSRNRNGFGSFDVLNKAEAFLPLKTDYSIDNPYESSNLSKLVKKVDSQPYTCFSTQTKVFKSKELFDSWDTAMAGVGKIYREARLKLEGKHIYEKRQYIGAPIIEKKVTRSFLDRHAKPYFIKIDRESGKYRAYILYLPSMYCEGLDKDIDGGAINRHIVNSEFQKICKEFNEYLSKKLDKIL